MNVIELEGSLRTETNGRSARETRKEGNVPGVLYGSDNNVHFTADALSVRKLIYTPNFHLIDLSVDGATHRCIVKAYQRHPVTDAIEHVDLLELQKGRKLKVEVPVKFTGVAAGIKAGGTLVQKLRKIRIKTTPEHLVDKFEVDVTDLDLGQSVRVRDMDVADGIEIMNPDAIPMASIEIPRALKAAEAADAKAAEELAEGEEGEEGAAEEKEETTEE